MTVTVEFVSAEEVEEARRHLRERENIVVQEPSGLARPQCVHPSLGTPGLVSGTVRDCGDYFEIVEEWDLTVPGCPMCPVWDKSITKLTRTQRFSREEWSEISG